MPINTASVHRSQHGQRPGTGYLPPENAPFYISSNGGGLPNATHPYTQARFETRYKRHQSLNSEVIQNSPLRQRDGRMAAFDAAARNPMYDADVAKIFAFTQDERNHYGNTGFGNACVTARNLLAASWIAAWGRSLPI